MLIERSKSALLIIVVMLFLGGCATLPENFDRSVSYAYSDTESTRLGKARRDEIEAHPGKSGFYLLSNGLDAFVARALLARQAEKSIDVQYYLYHDDLTGRLFTDQLLKAANRGVRIRLLVDDMGLGGRELATAVMDTHPNIELRIFNPFTRNTGRTLQFLTRFGSVTRRMHNKSFTVDNQVTILGGRNIGNEYFDADPDFAFSDLDVIGIGPVVKEVSGSFDQYWNHELSYPALVLKERHPTQEEISTKRQQLNEFVKDQMDSAYLNALRNSDLSNKIRNNQMSFEWGEADVVHDQPEKIVKAKSKTEYHLSRELKPHMDSVRDELIIFSPYFVPGKRGVALLKQLRERGVRVRILTNSLASTDVGIVHAGYKKRRRSLLRLGVELYEMNKKISKKERKEKKGEHGASKASLHAKSFIYDREKVFIGSLNLDPVAIENNTEIGVVINSKEMAGMMANWFDNNIDQMAFRLELKKNEDGVETILWHGYEDGEKRVFQVEPYTGFWQRLGINFMSIFPIESQL